MYHDVPLLTTASQARHAPRLAPYVDAHSQPRDGSLPGAESARRRGTALIFINAKLEFYEVSVVLASPDQLVIVTVNEHFGRKWTRVVI
jgi:hypothetical protein